jgi:dolichyl-phosphate-mannose--protein O-mannosyl transferase
MYYAAEQYIAKNASLHHSIFSFGNPVIWWGAVGALAVCICMWLRGKRYITPENNWRWHIYSHTWDIRYEFVFISFLAQYLPWVLVPRGTYIYHYFASVPFLILAAVLVTRWVMERLPRLKALPVVLLLAAALVCFILFYPYASGITAPVAWLNIGSRFLTLYHT